MGSASPKPTGLLVVNLPELLSVLHTHRVRVDLPNAVSIGKDRAGRWRTTALKEYAPALCRSFATAFCTAFSATLVSTEVPAPTTEEHAQYQSMVVTTYGEVIGADFHR